VNRGRIRPTTERAEVRSWIDKLGIVTRGPDAAIMSLSGGNQQKVLVARALRLNPKVLVLDDPTMGVDIGAREQMHLVIEQCAADGMAVLLVSADSDELARLSSRVLILSGGHVVRSLTPEDGMTVDDIDAGLLTPSN
jgi:ribose transport system ATP-binding protein